METMKETYTAPGLVFEFTETEPDHGGMLRITATNDDTKERLCDMFRKQEPAKTKYAPLASPEPFTVELAPRNTNSGRRAWYAIPVSLDLEWTEPYYKRLESMTGCKTRPQSIQIPAFGALCYTRHAANARIELGHFCADVMVEATPWNGLSGLDYAAQLAERCMKRALGDVETPREFIPNANGTYSPNPKYATGYEKIHARIPQYPGKDADAFWSALWSWWIDNHATDEQRRILAARVDKPYSALKGDYTIYYADPNGTCDWDGKGTKVSCMRWDEFAKLA